jgi:hypothetical protein
MRRGLGFLVAAALTAAACTSWTPTIPQEQAVAITRRDTGDLAPRAGLLDADLGPFSELGFEESPIRTPPCPGLTDLVWRIKFGVVKGPLDASGTIVVIGAHDRRVLQSVHWIS